MAINSKVFDDSSSIATAPPSQSSVFSFGRMKQKRAAVLSRIRDIVLAPNFNPSSVTPNLNACAAALPAAELSNILTQLNIEGHTALYWAIVNNRPQALWAFNKFISCYSPVCTSDLCIACMITSDHAMFMQLNLGRRSEQMRLRGLLGCPPDGIQVHTCDEFTNQFNVVLGIRMFQKRLRTATGNKWYHEFVAGGRIWWLRFKKLNESSNGIWHVDIGLCQHSEPARLNAVLLIEAHSRKPGCATPPEALKIPLSLTDTQFLALAPWKSPEGIDYVLPPKMTWSISKELGDWVMHNTTEYVDHEGTLHAKLEVTLL
ncbi:hypothetical protein DFJ58DRAFT_744823 [Suillus subalutaceus]|uniref:uncharacterized protein n=1 Tax=Suillus subalutaceus TaxID=48586 RepID=UPI001B87C379|nr:uncharacterized protein DFJ58DRAFT_744823 [Suillus subalutaceus]KAG1858774.1 hypothetical protein DFJ58DRAFT_744823 [Suillus subalutaceus]